MAKGSNTSAGGVHNEEFSTMDDGDCHGRVSCLARRRAGADAAYLAVAHIAAAAVDSEATIYHRRSAVRRGPGTSPPGAGRSEGRSDNDPGAGQVESRRAEASLERAGEILGRERQHSGQVGSVEEHLE
jgi:hypothetical protein